MGKVFGIVSLIVWLIGLSNVNQMTAGVFCAATACWLAILVRLHDAEKQHMQLIDALKGRDQAAPPVEG